MGKFKSVLEEMKERVSLELKGQDVNYFETPQYVQAFRDRRVLYSIVLDMIEENNDLKRRINTLKLQID